MNVEKEIRKLQIAVLAALALAIFAIGYMVYIRQSVARTSAETRVELSRLRQYGSDIESSLQRIEIKVDTNTATLNRYHHK